MTRPRGVLAAVGLGAFVASLGSGLVNVALPLLRREFRATLGEVGWVVTSYLLAAAALVLGFGRLGDLFGHRRVYIAGYATFGVSALLCAIAPSLGWLLAARALQGAGAAMLMACGPALLTTSFPPSERGKALGVQVTLTYLGLTLGPGLGGWLSGRLGVRTVFLTQVPVAVVGVALAWVLLPKSGPAPKRRFDVLGTALLAAGMTALLLAIPRPRSGSGEGGWVVNVGLAAAGVVVLVAFLRREGRQSDPIVPLWLLRVPAFGRGAAAAVIQYAVLFMTTFLMPMHLQGELGLDPARAGWIMTAQPAVMAAVAAFGGWLSDRVGARIPATLGMALLAAGVFSASYANTPSALAVALAIVGLGSGLFTPANNSSLMGAAPRGNQGTAAGVSAVARMVGMTAGVALGAGVFARFADAIWRAGGPSELGAFQLTLTVASGLAVVGTAVAMVRPAAS